MTKRRRQCRAEERTVKQQIGKMSNAARFQALDEVAQVIFSRASRFPPPLMDDSPKAWDTRLTALFLAKLDVAEPETHRPKGGPS